MTARRCTHTCMINVYHVFCILYRWIISTYAFSHDDIWHWNHLQGQCGMAGCLHEGLGQIPSTLGSLDVKNDGIPYRTVQWNTWGNNWLDGLELICWCFLFPEHLVQHDMLGDRQGDQWLYGWKEETPDMKQPGMVEMIKVLGWIFVAFTYEVVRLEQYERGAHFRFGEGRLGAASMLEFFKWGNVPPIIPPILHHWLHQSPIPEICFKAIPNFQGQSSKYTTSFPSP